MRPFQDASRLASGRAERIELRRSLESFEARDGLEEAHRVAIVGLLDLPGDVSSREHYDPGHLTASAFVLSPDRSSLLLIYHSKLERWLQPGGHVDRDDSSLLEAARREVREETGLEEIEVLCAPFDLDVHEIPARGASPAHRHFDVRYLFRARTATIRSGSDAADARWFPLPDLGGGASDESVGRAVRKLCG